MITTELKGKSMRQYFNVADEREVRLKDLLDEDLSFGSDSEELADLSRPGSAEGQRPRILNNSNNDQSSQVIEKREEMPHQSLLATMQMAKKNDHHQGKIFQPMSVSVVSNCSQAFFDFGRSRDSFVVSGATLVTPIL